jgi:hypothetical protein
MSEDYLKRFTDVPALIYLLSHRAITLLDPKSWDDTNDSHYLSVYKEEKSLKTVLALCFTEASETYHHWRVFAGGSSGVCITFRRERLLNVVRRTLGITCQSVDYITLDKMRKKKPPVSQLPFIKRHGFQDECEFRIIYESKRNSLATKDIKIPLSSIEKITLSPWLPKALKKSVNDLIHSIKGCGKIKVVRSTLVSNLEWKKLASKAS